MVQITSHRQNFSKRLIQAKLGNRYLTDMLAWLCSRDGLGNIETAAIYTYQNQTLQLVSSHGCLSSPALSLPKLSLLTEFTKSKLRLRFFACRR